MMSALQRKKTTLPKMAATGPELFDGYYPAVETVQEVEVSAVKVTGSLRLSELWRLLGSFQRTELFTFMNS